MIYRGDLNPLAPEGQMEVVSPSLGGMQREAWEGEAAKIYGGRARLSGSLSPLGVPPVNYCRFTCRE